jgi:hypothetical protein
VQYRPGHLNVVADVLSRRGDTEAALEVHSGPTFHLYDDLRRELDNDTVLRAFRDSVVQERGAPWRVLDGLVLRGSRVYVPASSAHLPDVLQLAHSAGHEGIQKTLQRLRQDFIIDHDRQLYVILFVAARHINATRGRLCTQLDCYSCSKCHRRCGRTSRWISSIAFLAFMARASS